MNGPIHILQVEDSESDAALILRNLKRSGLDVVSARVEDAAGLQAALREREWTAIICDYRLPQFDAPAALAIVQDMELDIPFIVVSGTIGEDRAVAMMKQGAHDYLMKSHLERLAPAVQREINEAHIRNEHRRARSALSESEERFRSLLHSDVVGIFVGDEDRVIEANAYFLNLTGYTQEDLSAGKVLYEQLCAPGRAHELMLRLRALLTTGSCPSYEDNWVRKDGGHIAVLVGGVRSRSAPRPQFLGFVVDLTERNQLHSQLLQSQKLEGLGRLAGGVAHDFNNLLTVIAGYSAMLLEADGLSADQREALTGVVDAAGRATSLTRQLLAFSRKQIVEPKYLLLNDVISNFQKLLERLIGEDVLLTLSLSPDIGTVRADPGHIEQVIMNLAVNARDAMLRNGRLEISTKPRFFENDSQTIPEVPPGHYVEMAVTDTGTGIAPEILPQIFDPFFTTKAQGSGTGLGLSTVYGIVAQNGGSISVESVVGQGSIFRILFPVAADNSASSEPVRPHKALAGSETLLVAEDDEAIRHYVRKVLEKEGYRVVEASTGIEALKAARKNAHAIHLVLTDGVMPEMGGEELAGHLRGILPDVPIVCMSGYLRKTGEPEGWATRYLAKPFTAAALLSTVRSVLDS